MGVYCGKDDTALPTHESDGAVFGVGVVGNVAESHAHHRVLPFFVVGLPDTQPA